MLKLKSKKIENLIFKETDPEIKKALRQSEAALRQEKASVIQSKMLFTEKKLIFFDW
jgi:hypothetical protein